MADGTATPDDPRDELTAKAKELVVEFDLDDHELDASDYACFLEWKQRNDQAVHELLTLADDPDDLRSLLGPPLEVGNRPAWQNLILTAAVTLEVDAQWRALTDRERAEHWADSALIQAAGLVPADWQRAAAGDLLAAVDLLDERAPAARVRFVEIGGWRIDPPAIATARRLLLDLADARLAA